MTDVKVNPRCLVVDVDDTISTHINRDYENAIPHLPMIQKLNAMHDSGWRIVYFTARGSISCNGDLERIERERRPVLEAWLKKHKVQYDELKFGKPIGVYYIDDKAIRPDEFMMLEHKVLKGGSGASVEQFGDRVIKRAPNVPDQVDWYKTARHFIRTPKIHTAYGDIIEMEMVKGIGLNDNCEARHIDLLLHHIGSIKTIKDDNYFKWSTMVSRIKMATDMDYPYKEEFLRFIDTEVVHNVMNAHTSFSHGDMTLENVILQDDDGLVFIDPNHPPGLYSSWLLDVGKLFQSLHYNYEERFVGGNCKDKYLLWSRLVTKLQAETSFDCDMWIFFMLEFANYVRMIKYKNPTHRAMVMDTLQRLGPLVSR